VSAWGRQKTPGINCVWVAGAEAVPSAPAPAGLQEQRDRGDSVGQGVAAALEVIF